MRLVILCEGDTEKLILKQFLQPYTQGFSRVDVSTPGGNTKLVQEFKWLAETELRADSAAIVFCLIDMLEAPFSFPKYVSEHPHPIVAQYQFIRTQMSIQIEQTLRERSFVFPVVMEVETWLLADADAINDYLSPPKNQRFHRPTNPESILYPADELKLWVRRFRGEDYVKTIHGRRLFQRANAERVYNDNCPYFEVIVNKLLELQGITPAKSLSVFAIPNQEIFEQMSQLHQQSEGIYEKALNLSRDDPALVQLDAQLRAIESKLEELAAKLNDLYA